MALGFLDEGQSFIIVCNDKMDERDYFKHYLEAFAKQCGLPLTAFGGYVLKLNRGVKVCYILQEEWINMAIHLKKEKSGEVEPLPTDWKSESNDRINREIEEAIEALYKLKIPIKDI